MSKKKLPLPTHVYPLGVRFQVEMTDDLDGGTRAEDEEPCWGSTVGFSRRIQINSTQDVRRQWTTLLHEYLHAALYVNGASANLKDEVEEMIVQSLEHAIEQFLLAHGHEIVAALDVQK